jgi:hypothetical protein
MKALEDIQMQLEFGDRLFWGILLFIAVIFAWLGVFEKYFPLWLGAIVGFVGGFLFVLLGPGARGAARSKEGA